MAHTARVGPKAQLGSNEFPRAEVQCFESRYHKDGNLCKSPILQHDTVQDGLRGYCNISLAVETGTILASWIDSSVGPQNSIVR